MRKRNPISTLRSFLYGWARALGDVTAILKGPGAMGKRIIRRAAGKVTARALWRWFK
jgi:hypothetical protein